MNRSLSILEIAFSSAWGGLEIIVGKFAAWFQQQGHRVTVIIPNNRQLEEYLRSNTVKWKRITPMVRYVDLVTAFRIAHIIERENVDIIHGHISRDLSTIRLAVNIAKRGAIVFTQHMDSQFVKKDIFHRWIYRGIMQIITITDSMREHQLLYTPAFPEQVKRIYNGVDTEYFKPINGNLEKLKYKFGIDSRKRIVSCIARLDRKKNQKLLIDSAAIVLGRHPNCMFLIVGDETPSKDGRGYKRVLLSAIAERNLEGYIRIMGYNDAINEIIALSEVIVLTTPKESFGLILIESMAMEKPVIGSRAGGPMEIISDNYTGRLFEPDNAESLAMSIIELLDNPGHAKQIGENGRSDVVNRFSMEKNFREYENEFHRIAQSDLIREN